MIKYDLFLDESGHFGSQDKMPIPSLVGGYLVPANTITKEAAADILYRTKKSSSLFANLSIRPLHAKDIRDNDMYFSFVELMLGELIKKKARLVIFQNKERLDILNGDITYLNIFSQGVAQLLQTLITEHNQQVELRIIAAHRRNVELTNKTNIYQQINLTEYVERIKERIVLKAARFNSSQRKLYKQPFIEISDALNDERLMLADAICHTWYTKANRFNNNQLIAIADKFSSGYEFTAFEKSMWQVIQEQLQKGRIGVALFDWYSNQEDLVEFEHIFINTLQTVLDSYTKEEIGLQLQILMQLISGLISIERNHLQCEKILRRLQESLIPLLVEKDKGNPVFYFDIPFYLLTVATNRGDVLGAEEYIATCRQSLKFFAGRWETIDYYITYKIREIEHLKNCYQFERAILELDKLADMMTNIVDMLQMIDEISATAEQIGSDTFGKILGSRLQARTYLVHRDQEQINKGRADSMQAIEHFSREEDKRRQYQYRAQLEYSTGNFEDALSWLGKAFCPKLDCNPQSVLDGILAGQKKDVLFGCMHYVRLMSAAYTNGVVDLGSYLYHTWLKENCDKKLDLNNPPAHYPYNIILWKLGAVMLAQGKAAAAEKYYKQAQTITKVNSSNYTILSMGVGMMMEKPGLMVQANLEVGLVKQAIIDAVNEYGEFMSLPLPQHFSEYFLSWQEVIDALPNYCYTEQANMLLSLAKEVPY